MKLELIKSALAALLLLVTWGVGQRIIAFYDIQKKRREIDIGTESALQSLYGEFKDVGRLWRLFRDKEDIAALAPSDTRWLLLMRATAAESRVESMLVKIATERVLSREQRRKLGLFRQAYQQLRESIRDDTFLRQSFSDPDYHYFNNLIVDVSRILTETPVADSAISTAFRYEALRSIIDVRKKDYEAAVNTYVRDYPPPPEIE